MDYKIIEVWPVETGDGYTSRPIAYFETKAQAELWKKDQRDSAYMHIGRSIPAVHFLLENLTYLLGAKIDLNHKEQKRQEQLINNAKSKLTPEELQALLNANKEKP